MGGSHWNTIAGAFSIQERGAGHTAGSMRLKYRKAGNNTLKGLAEMTFSLAFKVDLGQTRISNFIPLPLPWHQGSSVATIDRQ